MVMAWLGLGTKNTRMDLGKDHGFGQNKYFLKVRGRSLSWLQ